jgi:hypothetical protein
LDQQVQLDAGQDRESRAAFVRVDAQFSRINAKLDRVIDWHMKTIEQNSRRNARDPRD